MENMKKYIDYNPIFGHYNYNGTCFNVIMRKKSVDKLERLQLDRTLNALRKVTTINKPTKGWVKTIRENLGMTVMQLAKRLGTKGSRITEIEMRELNGGITLRSLMKTAEALNCKLFYVLIPEKPLQTIVEEQAKKQIIKNSKSVCQSMELEGQGLDDDRMKDFIEVQAEEMLHNKISKVWEE